MTLLDKIKFSCMNYKIKNADRLYLVACWANWGIIEVPWTKKYTKDGYPIVYKFNDPQEEIYECSINNYTSAAIYWWYTSREDAEKALSNLKLY